MKTVRHYFPGALEPLPVAVLPKALSTLYHVVTFGGKFPVMATALREIIRVDDNGKIRRVTDAELLTASQSPRPDGMTDEYLTQLWAELKHKGIIASWLDSAARA